MPKKIVFQGEPGANSHLAIQEVCPEGAGRSRARPSRIASPRSTKGEADLAMIPIENSLAGRVADIHHLLPTSGLHIIGEHFLPIHFQLMAPKGATLKDIKTVHSHIHALGQCRKIIRKHGWKAIVEGDTAGAAREIAELGDLTRAALRAAPRRRRSTASRSSEEDVEDEAHNTTRFIILSKKDERAPAGKGPVVTTFVFRVRNVPAALYKAMGGFATNGVNMTKLESYQLDGQFTATQFYADVDGHPSDRPLKLALEELAFFSTEIRILGVYPASPFRKGLPG